MELFPLAYFGPISYYKKLCQAENPQFEVKETYPKQTLRNRMSILSPNGVLDLSIPVTKPNGSKSITEEILLSPSKDWRRNHWKALQASYASSPFFDHYGIDIHSILMDMGIEDLKSLHVRIQHYLKEVLDLNFDIQFTTDFSKNCAKDYRNHFESKDNSPIKPYQQVFSTKESFVNDLSILDALFCEGPMARNWIVKN